MTRPWDHIIRPGTRPEGQAGPPASAEQPPAAPQRPPAASPPIKFMRGSLAALLDDAEARGPTARGVVMVLLDKDDRATFRTSGFTGKADRYTLSGLLEWIKHDLMSD